MQQMPPMQQHMPSQMEQMNNVSPQMMAQLQQAQQQQMHKQLLQQQMAQQMQQAQAQEKPMPTPILKKQVVEHLDANNSGNSNSMLDGIKDVFFANRDALVLLLLFCVICTPQVNVFLNKIPNTSDLYSYPNYLGILLRGVLLVGTYLTLKKLNFI